MQIFTNAIVFIISFHRDEKYLYKKYFIAISEGNWVILSS